MAPGRRSSAASREALRFFHSLYSPPSSPAQGKRQVDLSPSELRKAFTTLHPGYAADAELYWRFRGRKVGSFPAANWQSIRQTVARAERASRVLESARLPTASPRRSASRLEQPVQGGALYPKIFVVGS